MNAVTVAKPPSTDVKPAVESGLKFLPNMPARALAEHLDRDAVVAECRAMVSADKPVAPQGLALIYERLAIHYPEDRLTPAEKRLKVQDWLRLMGHLPRDILEAAADAYLLSPARFFPTPGQLKAHADALWAYRQALAQRARAVLDLIESTPA